MNVWPVFEEIKACGLVFDYDALEKKIDDYIHASKTDQKRKKRTEKIFETLKAIIVTDIAEMRRVKALPGFDQAAYDLYPLLFDTPQLAEHKILVGCERSIRGSLTRLAKRLELNDGQSEAQVEQSPGS